MAGHTNYNYRGPLPPPKVSLGHRVATKVLGATMFFWMFLRIKEVSKTSKSSKSSEASGGYGLSHQSFRSHWFVTSCSVASVAEHSNDIISEME